MFLDAFLWYIRLIVLVVNGWNITSWLMTLFGNESGCSINVLQQLFKSEFAQKDCHVG